MGDTTFDSINNLGSQTFISGDTETFIFPCVDENGAALDLTGATCLMKICPIGQTDVISVFKAGTITNAVGGIWQVVLLNTDTSSLYGVYQAQPQVNAQDGHIFKPGQLLLNIVRSIA